MTMTFKWTLQHPLKLAVLELGGSLSSPALRKAHDAATALPDWHTGYNLLVILDDTVRTGSLDLEAMETHRAYMLDWNRANRTNPGPRTAMVCSDALKRSMARLWALVTDEGWPIEIAIFADADTAIAWLNERRDDVETAGIAADLTDTPS
ncbi:hypothetical protein [Maricaulis sp.]|uniref:hypothetical protein n=1 Tax=Maricaulis sp. TaxID=1486257 RepID=UPI003A8E219B